MPAHLSGPDGIYITIGLILAMGLVISGWLKENENDAICKDCAFCGAKRQQLKRDRAEARVASFIRDGICPKCRWHLENGHCGSCGKDWKP